MATVGQYAGNPALCGACADLVTDAEGEPYPYWECLSPAYWARQAAKISPLEDALQEADEAGQEAAADALTAALDTLSPNPAEDIEHARLRYAIHAGAPNPIHDSRAFAEWAHQRLCEAAEREEDARLAREEAHGVMRAAAGLVDDATLADLQGPEGARMWREATLAWRAGHR